ncbi:MAG: hypothetical protein ACKVZJ_09110 [Phycisphaerales bacterium]
MRRAGPPERKLATSSAGITAAATDASLKTSSRVLVASPRTNGMLRVSPGARFTVSVSVGVRGGGGPTGGGGSGGGNANTDAANTRTLAGIIDTPFWVKLTKYLPRS